MKTFYQLYTGVFELECMFSETGGIGMNRYLAIDIGASSGRHIVGWKEDGEIRTKEVYRFPNGAREEGGHLVWDVEALLREVKNGIGAASGVCLPGQPGRLDKATDLLMMPEYCCTGCAASEPESIQMPRPPAWSAPKPGNSMRKF